MKKQIATVLLVCLVLLGSAMASKKSSSIPRTLVNARYVYVTSTDGDALSPNVSAEDRAAIAAVQDAIRKWGKLALVYRLDNADVILAVESHGSDDLLALYDARSWPSQTYLWRATSRNGLQRGKTPLFSEFQEAWSKMTD